MHPCFKLLESRIITKQEDVYIMKRKMRLAALLTFLAIVFALQTCVLAQENVQGEAKWY